VQQKKNVFNIILPLKNRNTYKPFDHCRSLNRIVHRRLVRTSPDSSFGHATHLLQECTVASVPVCNHRTDV